MSHKMEEIIKKRLSSETSKSFDKDFWNKFESDVPKESWFSFSFLIPVAAAIVLILFISTQSQIQKIDKTAEQLRSEEAKILADLDQQDWEILLGEDFDS